mgnify:CR=1 FL=1
MYGYQAVFSKVAVDGFVDGSSYGTERRFSLRCPPVVAALAVRAAEAERARAEGRFLIPTTLGAERATNPFLRAGEPSLAQSVDLAPGTHPSVVFAALRAWKNRF